QFHYDTAIDSVESVDCGKILISSDQRREVFDRIVICAGVGSRRFAAMLGDHVNVYPVKGYSITVHLDDEPSRSSAPWVSILDDRA
ncbi:FAD-dependent oxidoreductase, partial [Paraburkholderia sp. SIMBA_030]